MNTFGKCACLAPVPRQSPINEPGCNEWNGMPGNAGFIDKQPVFTGLSGGNA